MNRDLSKAAASFLAYLCSQRFARVDIGFIDGSTRYLQPLIRRGLVRMDGYVVVVTDAGKSVGYGEAL
ncbi:MAG: hypothetical protein BGO05_05300 [Rhizobiales bacterium 63-7]|nr:hypothetical protein [Hyphomicrobiales bacterium]OJU66620.1 MAG: hypothetical protein BGO05_05300 [Rhizobiales bacterium 63-7]